MNTIRPIAFLAVMSTLISGLAVRGEPPLVNEPHSARSIVAPGAQLQLLDDQFAFTEGPAADRHGNVFFTDQPNDRILKWSVDGKLETFLQPCGRSNGLFFDHQGHLLACADEHNQLWSIAPDGEHTILIGSSGYQNKRLNGPNDLWVHPNGGIYFTDPFYKRRYWDRGPTEQDVQAVYYLPPDRSADALARVVSDLVQPNGIVGTPDGRKLYVADIGGRKTYRYDIGANGKLRNKQVFCDMGSDGMTIDSLGNIYLTGKGVTVFNSRGEQIEQIPVDGGWTANVCFGGRDRKTLFITSSRTLLCLRMNVKGVTEPVMGAR